MRRLAVLTVGRSDYGIYQPVLAAIEKDPDFELELIVSGQHLSPEFGMTVNEIETDGYQIIERVEMLLSADTPAAISKSMGLGMIGFAQAFERSDLEALIVLGDRFEMMAGVLAALPFGIPIIHIHGGELTLGAIDDQMRHSITKMSQLHFVSTETYRERVIQLGESPKRVIVCGAPSLDRLNTMDYLTLAEINAAFKIELEPGFAICTYHPVTTEYEKTEQELTQLLSVFTKLNIQVLFTMPNADTAGRSIRELVLEYCRNHENAFATESMGSQAYFSAMKLAGLMVGNSSSGILEAGALKLPVVNIGTRQDGRVRGINVIDCEPVAPAIEQACLHAISSDFLNTLESLKHPYGGTGAAKVILDTLKRIDLSKKGATKGFYDLPGLSKLLEAER